MDHCGILMRNFVSGGMFNLCTAPGTVFTSLIASAKQSVNSVIRFSTSCHSSSVMSGPIEMSDSICFIHSGLKGSVCQV